MKQLSSFKYFLGLPLLCVAGSTLANPPSVNFNGWNANAGVIDTTVSCSTAGITCTTQVQDDGFLIEKIETADYTYLRFVVTDPNATGATSDLAFAAETFVPFAFNSGPTAGMTQGISSLQVIRETATGFESSAELQRSMMRLSNPAMRTNTDILDPTPPEDMYSLKLSQTITDPDNGYVDTFDLVQYTAFATAPNLNPDSDVVIGQAIDITQRVDIGEDADPAAKQQYFQQNQRKGVSGNAITKPPFAGDTNYYVIGDPLSTANSMTLDGTTVTWADGDEIVSNWLVQEDIMSDTTALAHQTIDNRTTGVSAFQTDISTPLPVTPFAWEPVNFGTEPSFP